MDKNLKKLKEEFEKKIPSSISKLKKQAILQSVREEERKVQNKRVAFLPKSLTAIVYIVLILAIAGIANQQLGIIDFSNGESGGGNENNPDKGAEAIGDRSENEDGDMIFDPYTIEIGDHFGQLVVTHFMGDKILSILFQGDVTLEGKITRNDADEYMFFPNPESVDKLPFHEEPPGKIWTNFANPDKLAQSINLEMGDSIDMELRIEEFRYNYNTNNISPPQFTIFVAQLLGDPNQDASDNQQVEDGIKENETVTEERVMLESPVSGDVLPSLFTIKGNAYTSLGSIRIIVLADNHGEIHFEKSIDLPESDAEWTPFSVEVDLTGLNLPAEKGRIIVFDSQESGSEILIDVPVKFTK